MLKSLYISSFVIIDEVQVEFCDGMTVLTGETGAGKSIIIDAIGQLLGNRTQSQFVKKGAEKAYIEGIFDINNADFVNICNELNIHVEDEIVISKEIYSNGKSTIKLNHRTISLNTLKLIMPYLLDIYSQFETQSIFSIKKHIEILDLYIDNNFSSLKEEYQELYNEYRQLLKEQKQLINEDLSDEQIEFYQTQLNEIDELPYSDEEIEQFEKELSQLENYEKLNESIQSFDNIISNETLSSLKESLYYLSNIKDEEFEEYYDHMYNIYYDLKDNYDSIMSLYNSYQFDEYRFNELQDILYKVNRLKRKYGYSMEIIQEKKNELISKIEIINNRDEYLLKIEKNIQEIYNKTYDVANKIHQIRKEYALKLEKQISNELFDLYLPNAKFKMSFHKTDLSNNGIDSITFLISTNKGQELSPLHETASGGEISRIMLALKTIITQSNHIDTIIFDEVDTGVSGKVASRIGEKMLELSKNKQVICITHLPQVAACATSHFAIEKETKNSETNTSIRLLDRKNRIEELAKMLSGDTISDEARKNAEKLLKA